jgi:hypothetical protein
MSKLMESSEFLYTHLQNITVGAAALERAAVHITDHNVRMRTFMLRIVDPEDLGHAVTDEVRKIAGALLTMDSGNGRS